MPVFIFFLLTCVVPVKVDHNQILLAERTNAVRIKNGLKPLEFDQSLMDGADRWAKYMADTGNFRHDFSAGVAENIAMGQRNIIEVIQSWWDSIGHRQNMLNRRHTKIGVGVRQDRRGTKYWVQRFK